MHTVNKAALVVMFPAVLLHEVTHAVGGLVVGGSIRDFSIFPPYVVVVYPEGTNTMAIRGASLSPTLLGLAAAVVWWPQLLGMHYILAAYIGACWVTYTLSVSKQDLHPMSVGAEVDDAS